MKRKFLLPLVLVALFAVQGWGSIDVYLDPGISLYGDAAGYSILSGAKIGLPFNLLTGGSLFISGGSGTNASVFSIGAGADVGYRLSLDLKGHDLNIDPMLTLGMDYESLADLTGKNKPFLRFLILPRVDAVYYINSLFGVGLHTGYHASLFPTSIPSIVNFYVGMSLSLRLNGLFAQNVKSQVKVIPKKEKISKSKGKPEIAVYIDGQELVSGKAKIDFGTVFTNSDSLSTNIVVSNLGTATLKLKGFSIEGTGLSLKGTDVVKLDPKKSVTIQLVLDRSQTSENRDVKFSILSDDKDESTSLFLVSGSVVSQKTNNDGGQE